GRIGGWGGRLGGRRRRPWADEGAVRGDAHGHDRSLSDGRRARRLRAARDADERRQPLRLRHGKRHPRGGQGYLSMTSRPAVTPALLEEYCKRFRNWDRWGADDEIGTLNFLTPDVLNRPSRLLPQGTLI